MRARYIVKLDRRSYTYKNFKEYRRPYSHIIAAANYLVDDPITLFHESYTQDAYRNIY
jgi:hypothetical protein